jgi:hypothetical protein
MTPDLKIACELIFQEHKLSGEPIKWNRDTFRGRVSFGLSEMAKDTLMKKNIIVVPEKSKKLITLLNPEVLSAGSFEEAEKMVGTKVGPIQMNKEAPSSYMPTRLALTPKKVEAPLAPPAPVMAVRPLHVSTGKWYLKPVFMYLVWPVCGAAAGILVARLMDFAYTELFLK